MVQIVGLFARTHARFEFAGSPEQAAVRLSSLIAPSVFRTWLKQSVVGKATPSKVVLYWHRPFVRNSFTPRFVGHFSIENGVTVLSGSFSLHPVVRWFMVAWLSLVFVPLVSSLVSDLAGIASLEGATGVPITTVMALSGIALVRFGRWCARADPAYISAVIRDAARPKVASHAAGAN